MWPGYLASARIGFGCGSTSLFAGAIRPRYVRQKEEGRPRFRRRPPFRRSGPTASRWREIQARSDDL